MFDTLQDRLSEVFKNLRGKSRLSEADLDATAREIRLALLEADVNLGVVKEFIANLKARAIGAEIHKALNPSQQIIKIVNDELVAILGGEARPGHHGEQGDQRHGALHGAAAGPSGSQPGPAPRRHWSGCPA